MNLGTGKILGGESVGSCAGNDLDGLGVASKDKGGIGKILGGESVRSIVVSMKATSMSLSWDSVAAL